MTMTSADRSALCGRRYPVAMMDAARKMRDGGWTYAGIRSVLAKHTPPGRPVPAIATIQRWTMTPEQAEQYLAHKRRRDGRTRDRKRGRPGRPFAPLPRQDVDRAIRVLHAAGLSHPAIAAVLKLYHGVEYTPDTVRRYAYNAGLPRRPRGRSVREQTR